MKKLLLLSLLFTQIALAQMPLGFSPKVFYDVTDAANVMISGTTVTSVLDLSGNGKTLIPTGNPQYVSSGINGLPSIEFTGTNRLTYAGAIGRTDLDKCSGYIVFKNTSATGTGAYNAILIYGTTSYTVPGANFIQLYNPNSTTNFNFNLAVNTLDATLVKSQLNPHYMTFDKNATSITAGLDGGLDAVKTGTQTVFDKQLTIGQWNGIGAKMLFSELCIFDSDNHPLSSGDWDSVKTYLRNKYSIAPSVEVTNQGVNSSTTDGLLSRVSEVNTHNFDLIYISIGRNDFAHTDSTKRLTVAQYKANLTAYVQSVTANGSQVIIMSILPSVDSKNTFICAYYGQPINCNSDALSEPYNTAAYEVSQEQGVGWFDSTMYFNNNCLANETTCSAYRSDGIHLNETGALTWAQIIYADYVQRGLHKLNIGFEGDSNTYGNGLTGGGTNTGQPMPAQFKILVNQ